jgi:tape measure domain-containing protein
MAFQARLEIGVDSRGAKSNVDQLDGSLQRVTKSGNAASTSTKKMGNESQRASRKVRAASNSVDRLARSARNFIGVSVGGFTAALAVRETVRAADSYANLRSQLRLVTDDQEALNRVYENTFQLAQDTRQDLESTINLYARLARATEEVGTSESDLLTITRAINQSFIVSGASAQEASSAILQLSQGIASGTLRGEELNSVLENSPRLARAIAEGLGVTIGQLRALGQEGRLTGEAVTSALLRTADTIERDFQTMERTVGQALQQLRNDLLDTFGQTDTSELVDAVDDLRDVVTDPQFQQSLVTLSSALVKLAAAAASATKETVGFAQFIGEEFAAFFNGPAPDDLVRLSDRIKNVRAELVRLGNVPGGREDARYAALEEELAGLEAQYNAAREAQENFNREANVLPPITVTSGDTGGAPTVTGAPSAEALKAEEEALNRVIDAAAARTAQQREARELDREYAAERAAQLEEVRQSLLSEERQIEESYQRRLEIVRANLGERSELEKQLTQQRNAELAALEREQTSLILTNSAAVFDSLAGLAKAFGDEQSSTYKALFATSKAFALADASLRLGAALAQGVADPSALTLPQKLANYATIASLMGSIVSTISSVQYAGAFDSGGRIPAGQVGLVGERGPELISGPAQVTGRQATSRMGGGEVVVNMHEDASKAGQVNQREADGQRMIDVFVSNIRSDGAAARAIQSTYGVQRRGT